MPALAAWEDTDLKVPFRFRPREHFWTCTAALRWKLLTDKVFSGATLARQLLYPYTSPHVFEHDKIWHDGTTDSKLVLPPQRFAQGCVRLPVLSATFRSNKEKKHEL